MSSLQSSQGYWVIVPAAGVGTRMGADRPKQYLTLNHKTILEHTLERLLQLPRLNGIVVAVSPQDSYWQNLPVFAHPQIRVIEGGRERCDSVLNALDSLDEFMQPLDWVLVHDAARPCVDLRDVAALIEELEEHLVGGILGVPVSDTVKRLNDNYGIEETVDRRVLWLAQTPQMFRYGVLARSLRTALQQGFTITDEASAVESAGYVPLMVEGRRDNIKVTRPEDIAMAELILRQQHDQQSDRQPEQIPNAALQRPLPN